MTYTETTSSPRSSNSPGWTSLADPAPARPIRPVPQRRSGGRRPVAPQPAARTRDDRARRRLWLRRTCTPDRPQRPAAPWSASTSRRLRRGGSGADERRRFRRPGQLHLHRHRRTRRPRLRRRVHDARPDERRGQADLLHRDRPAAATGRALRDVRGLPHRRQPTDASPAVVTRRHRQLPRHRRRAARHDRSEWLRDARVGRRDGVDPGVVRGGGRAYGVGRQTAILPALLNDGGAHDELRRALNTGVVSIQRGSFIGAQHRCIRNGRRE